MTEEKALSISGDFINAMNENKEVLIEGTPHVIRWIVDRITSELAEKEKEIEVLKRAVKTLSNFLDEKSDQLKNTKP